MTIQLILYCKSVWSDTGKIISWLASERAQRAKTLTRGIALLLFCDNVFFAFKTVRTRFMSAVLVSQNGI